MIKVATNRPHDPSAPATGSPASVPRPVVGLGASAGGLEALEQFFRAMPANSGAAFVVVQHLDPSHASLLSEILQRSTTMPVVEAQDGAVLAQNQVYVIPPNRDLVIFHGALQLSLPAEPRGQRLPIDAFLRSLAEDQGDNAVGIILSGTGTDGTLGLRAITGAGGLGLVQDPATARYNGMPESAAHSGYATRVLPVDEMPQALRKGVQRQQAPAVAPADANGMARVLMLLRSGTGHDFSLYKQSTIGRRIERRMTQHAIDDIGVYARFLKEHPAEVQALFRELLINVTSFFRDAEAFVALKDAILPALLADKPEGYVLRLWVAGCATGEEAYSIAMVLREISDESRREFKIQFYATDLDDDAIAKARTGVYPPNIAQDVSPQRLRRFFSKEEGGYRVKKEIRELVVFAVQSVVKDPPFTRLDLLACRNLMIYLEPELQNRLIPAMHYALKPGGVLFLSPSESVGVHTELFEPLNRKWKFYRALPSAASTRAVLSGGLAWAAEGVSASRHAGELRQRETNLADLARRTLLQVFAPASVVTDPQGNILYVHGDTGRFLRPAPGQPTHNIVDMAREGLPFELRDALRLAATLGQATLDRPVAVQTNDHVRQVWLSVRPMPDGDPSRSMLLVSFREHADSATPKLLRRSRRGGSTEALRVSELENELAHAKESMTAMLEEQQASNEELKSTNEELQSTNEEMQSTNEELETSKEELQSVNEELVTVNSELQGKIEQMAAMQDDMKNLLDNLRLGTIFLDRHLYIRRFTRDATQLFRLVATDVGRPLADIRSELQGEDLLADAAAVLESLVPVEREVRSAAGVWFLVRIQPYRTTDHVIDGVVITFADVSDRVEAIASRQAQALAEAVVDAVQSPLLVLDGSLRIVSANRVYYRLFSGQPETTIGRDLFDLNGGQWDMAPVHGLVDASGGSQPSRQAEFEHDVPGIGPRRLRMNVRLISEQGVAGRVLLLGIDDIGPAAAAVQA